MSVLENVYKHPMPNHFESSINTPPQILPSACIVSTQSSNIYQVLLDKIFLLNFCFIYQTFDNRLCISYALIGQQQVGCLYRSGLTWGVVFYIYRSGLTWGAYDKGKPREAGS